MYHLFLPIRAIIAVRLLVAVPLVAAEDRPITAAETSAVTSTSVKVSSAKPRPRITISKETTYITGPLGVDGYIDYIAALNQYSSKGVTPENNAVVPLMQAFGPGEIEKGLRERFFAALGMATLPETGTYYVDLPVYAKRWRAKSNPGTAVAADSNSDVANEVHSQLDKAMDRPWSKEEFPLLAAWLTENEAPIRLIVAGSQRPRFYVPMVVSGEPEMMKTVMWPLIIPSRESLRALRARAMLRLKAGRVDDAWQDLIACHRLARLVSQGPYLVDQLVSMALENNAVHGDLALAACGILSAEKASRFADELRALPPMAAIEDTFNHGERYFCLGCTFDVARNGPSAMKDVIGSPAPRVNDSWLVKLAWAALVDWNEPLRMVNGCFDRVSEALGKPTRAQRNAAIAQLKQDVKQMAAEARQWRWIVRNYLLTCSPRLAAGRHLGRFLTSELMAAFAPIIQAGSQTVAYQRMGQLAFLLAAHRADQGEFPAELAQLSPRYLKAIPQDPFGEAALRYKREPKGYLIYSVGPNGKDDGGRNWLREADHDLPPEKQPKIPQDADDLFLRAPPSLQ